MSNRWQKRKYDAETRAIIKKAKIDMERWMSNLFETPSEKEVRAFQAGYISGINRATGQVDK